MRTRARHGGLQQFNAPTLLLKSEVIKRTPRPSTNPLAVKSNKIPHTAVKGCSRRRLINRTRHNIMNMLADLSGVNLIKPVAAVIVLIQLPVK